MQSAKRTINVTERVVKKMRINGYASTANCYRKMLQEGKIDKETAEKSIRIYDFLADCDIDDICQMVDSTAFNDIIKAFLRMAVKKADIDQESQDKVLNQIRWIMDEKQAKEVLESN